MRRFYLPPLALLVFVLIAATPAMAAPDPRMTFRRLWERTDLAVDQQVVARSWTWGNLVSPVVLGTAIMQEPYAEAPGGRRDVLYFDKSRMEINDPSADPEAPWYITNGLLPVELMTGRIQIGYTQFEAHSPARIAAVGDPVDFPTYADLLPYYQSPGAVNPGDLGKPATGMINRDGTISGFDGYASDPATILVRGENNHGVAKAFVDFMNQKGLVYQNGRYIREQLYDPLFVFGLPVSGAYWVKTSVGGVERPILFQVFERRVLTYNPANPPKWRVEMGNVGRHYYEWRHVRGPDR
jgi:hypothetical protein